MQSKDTARPNGVNPIRTREVAPQFQSAVVNEAPLDAHLHFNVRWKPTWRRRLVEPVGGSGFSVAIETHGFWVRASSEAVPGLAQAQTHANPTLAGARA